MRLMRGFSSVEEGGKIPLPKNIIRETGLEKGQLVEIKLHGNLGAQYITIWRRKTAR